MDFDDKQFLSTVKFLGAAVVTVSMYLAYLCLIIKIDDAEKYNMEKEVLLYVQHSEDIERKNDLRTHKEYLTYIHQLERDDPSY